MFAIFSDIRITANFREMTLRRMQNETLPDADSHPLITFVRGIDRDERSHAGLIKSLSVALLLAREGPTIPNWVVRWRWRNPLK